MKIIILNLKTEHPDHVAVERARWERTIINFKLLEF